MSASKRIQIRVLDEILPCEHRGEYTCARITGAPSIVTPDLCRRKCRHFHRDAVPVRISEANGRMLAVSHLVSLWGSKMRSYLHADDAAWSAPTEDIRDLARHYQETWEREVSVVARPPDCRDCGQTFVLHCRDAADVDTLTGQWFAEPGKVNLWFSVGHAPVPVWHLDSREMRVPLWLPLRESAGEGVSRQVHVETVVDAFADQVLEALETQEYCISCR